MVFPWRKIFNGWPIALLCCAIVTLRGSACGQSATIDAGPVDWQIASALKQVSSRQIQADIEKLVGFGTRSTLSAEDAASIAAGHGIGAAREWIKSQLESYSRDCGGCLEVKADRFLEAPADRIPQPTEITNVYAVLKGTDASVAPQIILVSGHYDSRNSDTLDTTGPAPGANDDASGTAVSLECARVLSPLKFRATIIFLTVAGEEQGLNGSRHFAQMARSNAWKIEAVLNNDIVGGDRSPQQDPSLVRVFSEGIPATANEADLKRLRSLGGESDSPSRQLARYVVETSRTYPSTVQPLLVFRLDRYLRGGDHMAFNQQGYAAVRFTEFREDYHHQHQTPRTEGGTEYGDLLKFVDFDYIAAVARLNAAVMASLASAPAPPAKVYLRTKQLENDSTLSWDASPAAAGYEILWRQTTSADWEHVQSAGIQTRVTLPQSKDNVIFAVRAFDSLGHRSLPVVPVPEP
jgi:Peptidase family M28